MDALATPRKGHQSFVYHESVSHLLADSTVRSPLRAEGGHLQRQARNERICHAVVLALCIPSHTERNVRTAKLQHEKC